MTSLGAFAGFQAARRDPQQVVLEGVHALKHAIRFGAEITRIASCDPPRLAALLAELAPDVTLPVAVEEVPTEVWTTLTRGGLPSPALALARRPAVDLAAVLSARGARPVVLLDHPRHLGNVGAAIRVAAAAGADAVAVLGEVDPWSPPAVRGGAGLQLALPVGALDVLPASARTLVALDPEGAPIRSVEVPADAILAFGSERGGLTEEILARAALRVALPMRPGVSSLNLATAVAATLYRE